MRDEARIYNLVPAIEAKRMKDSIKNKRIEDNRRVLARDLDHKPKKAEKSNRGSDIVFLRPLSEEEVGQTFLDRVNAYNDLASQADKLTKEEIRAADLEFQAIMKQLEKARNYPQKKVPKVKVSKATYDQITGGDNK